MIGLSSAVAVLAAVVGPPVAPAAPLAPTLVELDVTEARLAEVLEELQLQAGFPVRVADSPDAGERRVTVKTGGKVPFWEAAELVARASGMRADAPPFAGPTWGAFTTDLPRDRIRTPAPDLSAMDLARLLAVSAEVETNLGKKHGGGVVFRPGRPAPAAVCGAVRVRTVPLPALPTVPADTIPVVLHLATEPGRSWKKVTGLTVKEAVDARGRALTANPVDGPMFLRPVELPEGSAAALAGARGENEPRLPQFLSPTHALIRLEAPADGKPANRLGRLSGEVDGVFWDAEEEMVSLRVGRKGMATRATGRHGVRIEALLTVPPEGTEGVGLIVVLGYDAGAIRPPGSSPWPALEPAQDATHEHDGTGVEHADRIDPKDPPAPERTVCGLTVEDANGVPFDLALIGNKRRLIAEGGRLVHSHVVELILIPNGNGTKPPAVVRFRAHRAVPVRVNFELKDVPIAAGALK